MAERAPGPAGPGALRLQTKLLVGGADDPSEHEADAVADQVTAFLASGETSPARREMRPPEQTRITRMATTTGAAARAATAGDHDVRPDRIRRARVTDRASSPPGTRDWTAPAAGRPLDVTAGSLNRSVEVIHRWPWSKKKDAPKKAAPPPPPPKGYAGPAGQLPSSTVEKVKPGLALGISGGAAAATAGTAGVSQAAGAFSGALSPILMGDAAFGLYNADKMMSDAATYGDAAMMGLGTRKAKDQGAGLGMAAVNSAKAGVEIGKAASSAAGTVGTLGVASGGLGVVAGGAMVLQGAWRGGKAIAALCRLSWGRGAEMMTKDGQRWKEYVQGAERMKVAVNATKIAIGALGIAAGVLMIASNPIGWAIGIAAAVAGGIYAITKIANKINNAKEKEAAAKKIKSGTPPEKVAGPDAVPEDAGPPDKQAKRKKAIEEADKVARLGSDNAHAAGAMRRALLIGNKDLVQQYLDAVASAKKDAKKKKGPEISGPMGVNEGMRPDAWMRERDPVAFYEALMTENDKRFHDALLILSAINVDYETAIADSGQELIEKKLSTTENM